MKPRVKLIYPDGAIEWYDDCAIEDSLIPDLSFVGKRVDSGELERVVTNLAYKIVRPAESDAEALQRECSEIVKKAAIPWRPIQPAPEMPKDRFA